MFSCDSSCTLSAPWCAQGSQALASLNQGERPSLTLSRFATSQALPAQAWELLSSQAKLGLSRAYLNALESVSAEGSHHYLLFEGTEGLMGLAHLERVSFKGPSVSSLVARRAPLASRLLSQLRPAAEPLDVELLMCGSGAPGLGPSVAFASGLSEAKQRAVMSLVAQEAQRLMRESRGGAAPLSAVLIQGLSEGSAATELERGGLTRFEAEPSMALKLDSGWGSFEELLEDFSSKYRVKARRAEQGASALEQLEFSAAQLRERSARLEALYRQVTARARFCVSGGELASLAELLERLPEQVKVYGYLLQGELIGFRVSLRQGGTLYAHLVGLDYAHNRERSLYPKMLNDYLREGIERGCERVDFGRTAAEIKSTLGAEPHPTALYLAHAHPLVQASLPALSRRIELPIEKQHLPFKASWYEAQGRSRS